MHAGVDADELIEHLRVLAADDMDGRESQTAGIARARRYLREQLTDIGAEPLFPGYEQPFVFDGLDGKRTQGLNIVGLLRGEAQPESYVTISAHYDHLGRSDDGRRFNGADDNASGVAAVLELARAFANSPPDCTLVFCFFDGEEAGLHGSRAFVERAAIPLERIALEINVDMIGRADEGLLWVAGTHHWPWLAAHVDAIAAEVRIPLVRGHDRFSLRRGDNWTQESDHGSFHKVGVPWLHFGVSNHADTHQQSDEVGNIDTKFFRHAADAVLVAVQRFSGMAEELLRLRREGA